MMNNAKEVDQREDEVVQDYQSYMNDDCQESGYRCAAMQSPYPRKGARQAVLHGLNAQAKGQRDSDLALYYCYGDI